MEAGVTLTIDPSITAWPPRPSPGESDVFGRAEELVSWGIVTTQKFVFRWSLVTYFQFIEMSQLGEQLLRSKILLVHCLSTAMRVLPLVPLPCRPCAPTLE